MSLTLRIAVYRPRDEEFDNMKAAWNACQKAHIPIPKQVSDFFDGMDPNEMPGVEIDVTQCLRRYETHDEAGFELDLQTLPSGSRYIRIAMT